MIEVGFEPTPPKDWRLRPLGHPTTLRQRGIEPRPPRWQRGILTTELLAHLEGRNRTSDLGITATTYSPPLCQLSYLEIVDMLRLASSLSCQETTVKNNIPHPGFEPGSPG